MTIINQKSISGITSITTAAAGDNLLTFHTNDGTERFRIDNSGSTKITAGIVTTLTVTGNGTVGGTLGVTGNGTVGGTLGVTGETTFATHINLGDSDKAKFGASGDLEIYHDGSHSYIQDNGTGAIKIKGDDLRVENAAGRNILKGTSTATELYFDNGSSSSKKFETKSDGVSVTGEIAATGAIDAEGRADIGSTSLNDYAVAGFSNSATYGGIYAQNNNANGYLFTGQENSTEVFKVHASGRIDSGNQYTSGDGVNIFAGGSIYIRQDGSTGGVLRIRNGSDYKIELKGNGNADFAGAVKIGGTADANEMEEYEEGTWTPNIGGTATYDIQWGYYIKIGKLVQCWGGLRPNSMGTGNAKQIQNLPFTSLNTPGTTMSGGGAIVWHDNCPSSITNTPAITNHPNTTSCNINAKTAASTTLGDNVNFWQNNHRANFFITYQAI